MFSTRKANAIATLVLVLVTVGVFYGSMNLKEVTPRYTNKTEQQQSSDMTKIFYDMSVACEKAGGTWVVGFTQALCSVADYERPDTSWYQVPQFNELWDWLDKISSGLFVLGIVVGILAFGAFMGILVPL